jgi:hypothetical protein
MKAKTLSFPFICLAIITLTKVPLDIDLSTRDRSEWIDALREAEDSVSEEVAAAGASALEEWSNVLDHLSLARKVYIAMLVADR